MIYASICLLAAAVLIAAWPPFRIAVAIITAVMATMAITAGLTWALLTSEGGEAPFLLGILVASGIALLLVPQERGI